jgi:Xaa-Pro dipeptidase
MKAKSLKISDPNLVAWIMEYVKRFRIRSSHILDGVAEYVVLHNGTNLSGPHLSSVLEPFGLLDYQPPNGLKFWQIFEKVLGDKFVQLPPKDVVELLLSCVYLKKYPLNFVDRVFSPYFLDRLHTSEKDFK